MEKQMKVLQIPELHVLLTDIPIPYSVETKHNIISHEKLGFYKIPTNNKLSFTLNIFICVLLLPQVGERIFKCLGSNALHDDFTAW